MSGNVWEWENSYDTATGATDYCRVRGGSYVQTNNDATGVFLRCDTNNNNSRNLTDSSIGFRCCSSP